MKKIILLTILIGLTHFGFTANIYWVGLSGNNDWSTAGNWSDASGVPHSGTPTVPTSTDIAIFDGAGTGNVDCNISSNISVQGISLTGIFSGNLTQSSGFTITIGSSGYAQSTGNFIGSDSNIDLNGEFSLSGGNFTSTSATLFIGRNVNTNLTIFNHTAGSFDHNNGTVEFDPTCTSYNTRTYTIDVIPSTIFNNIVLDATSTQSGDEIITTATGDIVEAIGNITHDDGQINGSFSLDGNLIINSEANGGSGWFIFDGSAAQTYTVASGSPRTIGIEINKTAGNVSPNATTEFRIQRFNQVLGDFTAPTGIFFIGGSWNANLTIFNHTAGSFDHNNGTVEFDPTCTSYNTRTYTIDVIPSTIFNNIVLDATSTQSGDETIFIANGDTLHAVGNALLDDGATSGGWIGVEGNATVMSTITNGAAPIVFLGNNAQTFDLTGATSAQNGAISIDKTGNTVQLLSDLIMDATSQDFSILNGEFNNNSFDMSVSGDWTNNDIYTHTGNRIVRFIGTGTQILSGTSITTFYDVEMNNTGAGLNLQQGIIIPNILTMTDGHITLNGGDIDLLTTGVMTGETNANRVLGDLGQIIAHDRDLSSTSTVYTDIAGLGINITTGGSNPPGLTTFARGHQIQGTGPTFSIRRYFDITPTNNSSLDLTMQIEYYDGELNGQSEANLVMWRSIDLGVSWTNEHGTAFPASNYVEKNAIPAFSRWTLSNELTDPLPIELLTFNAIANKNIVNLTWTTEKEINNDYFTIERSKDGESWKELSIVDGAGNSDKTIHYKDTDSNPLQGVSYYRLMQTDYDGTSTYSQVVEVFFGEENTLNATVFPNPSTENHVFVQLENIDVSNKNPANYSLFTINGQELQSGKLNEKTSKIDLTNIASGVYILNVNHNQLVKHFKIIKK